jgi:hypothetical protein
MADSDAVAIEENWNISFSDIKLGELIGKGSFGSVYKSRFSGIDVAVKHIRSVYGQAGDFYHEVAMLRFAMVIIGYFTSQYAKPHSLMDLTNFESIPLDGCEPIRHFLLFVISNKTLLLSVFLQRPAASKCVKSFTNELHLVSLAYGCICC